MLDLRLPLDFERLPEFWQLKDSLSVRRGVSPRDAEPTAVLLWLRLWVLLGYLAQSTSRPGALCATDLRRLLEGVSPAITDATELNELLTLGSTPLLVPLTTGATVVVWECPLFKRLNFHLAGDYKPAHIKGNIRSRLSAAKNNIAADALTQAMLLPPEKFRYRDGSEMTSTASQRALVIIMTLDRCLKQPNRSQQSFTEGVMADAGEVVRRGLDSEALQQFYYWVAESGSHPAIPKSTEEILRDFERIHTLSLQP